MPRLHPCSRTRTLDNHKTQFSRALLILIFCLFFMCALSAPSFAASFQPYFPANTPILFPDTADMDGAGLELFIDDRDRIHALNYKAGQLTIFNPQGVIENDIQLPLPAELTAKSGSIWIDSGKIYLKPSSDRFVWIFDSHGALTGKIKLKTAEEGYYNFTDIVADPRGYIYLLDGNSLQVRVFDRDGNDHGVFAKRSGRAADLPGWPESFFLDNQGNFYFSTRIIETGKSQIVKYSYQGQMLARYSETPATHHYTNIWVDQFQNLYAMAPAESLIVKFDERGQKICQFQARSLSGLAVNSQGTVYLDSPKGRLINLFLPSRMAVLIDQGNRALAGGMPDQAEIRFKQALVLNNQLTYLHSILGEVYFHQRRWTEAMAEFRYLRDNWRYSQALTSFRNSLLVNDWPFLLAAFVGIIGLIYLLFPRLKKMCSQPVFAVFKILSRPGETLRTAIPRLTPAPAWMLVLGFVFSKYFSWYYTNPIFSSERQVFSFQIFSRNLVMVLVLVFIWTWVAYKVGELFQGMAAYSHILAGTAVSLIPLLIGYPVLACLSHLLTFQEIWIYQWIGRILNVWAAFLFVYMIKTTEDFDWSKTFGVGLINLASTGLTLVFISFLAGVNQQLANFLIDLFNEVYNRITT